MPTLQISIAAVIISIALALAPGTAILASDLPPLEADALSGVHVSLPAAAGGKPFVLIVGYDRSAKDAVQRWSHELAKAIGERAIVYAVVDAAGAPGFVHGFIRSDVAKSAPAAQEQHRSNVLVTFDRTGWPGLAPSGAKADPAIVVVDANHAIVFAKREAFSDESLAQALAALH